MSVAICNLALALIGEEAQLTSLDPPHDKVTAACARFYPLARDTLLGRHPWSFAQQRWILTPLDLPAWQHQPWKQAYVLPATILRPLRVASIEDPSSSVPFIIASRSQDDWGLQNQRLLLTDRRHALLEGTARLTEASLYPPSFTEALAALLASYLAGSISRDREGTQTAQTCWQRYQLALREALLFDAHSQRLDLKVPAAPWMLGRALG